MKDQKPTERDARESCEAQRKALIDAINAREEKIAFYECRPTWAQGLDERQWGLVKHCRSYVSEGAHGLPGHQLMVIVNHLACELEEASLAPEYKEIVEFERWFRNTFGSLVKGNTVKERVMSVVQHYINQMGRWLERGEK